MSINLFIRIHIDRKKLPVKQVVSLHQCVFMYHHHHPVIKPKRPFQTGFIIIIPVKVRGSMAPEYIYYGHTGNLQAP